MLLRSSMYYKVCESDHNNEMEPGSLANFEFEGMLIVALKHLDWR
jgi:hypothetical protein